jgi:hypothetical protein
MSENSIVMVPSGAATDRGLACSQPIVAATSPADILSVRIRGDSTRVCPAGRGGRGATRANSGAAWQARAIPQPKIDQTGQNELLALAAQMPISGILTAP